MTSELVHRIRTCVAAMLANDKAELPAVYRDAADLMLEASNMLDVPEPLGEPMPILAPSPGAAAANPQQINPYQNAIGAATWGTDMSVRYVDMPDIDKPRVCPGCHQHTASIVNRVDRRLWLTCQECAHRWEYVA